MNKRLLLIGASLALGAGSTVDLRSEAALPGPEGARPSGVSAAGHVEQAWRFNNLGVALLEQFKHAEAAEAFRKALALRPELAAAQVNLAVALFNVPDLEAAEQAAAAAVRTLPDAPQPHYLTGLVAKAQNRMDVATAAFTRVLALDPQDVGAHVNLGQLLVQERRYPEAMEHFRAAIAAEPYNVTATYNLAMALMRTGATADGHALMKRFQSLRETGRGSVLGGAYPEQGRYAEGITSTGAERELVDRETPPVTYRIASQVGSAGEPGASVALLDVDQDGDLDAVTTTWETIRLHRNEAGRLSAADAGVAVARGGGRTPAVAGDYDNDGRVDVFARGRLLHNEGGGKLVDVTTAAGLTDYAQVSRAAAWLDADHDGDLDLFLAGFSESVAEGAAGAAHHLYRNDGNGRFTDITEAAKLAGTKRRAVALVPTDFDNRRDIDVLVVNADGGVELYKNTREGAFEEVAASVGLPSQGRFSCVASGDVNKDGYTDFYLGQPDGGGLLAASTGRGGFRVAPAPQTSGPALAAQFLDYDNDGLLDLVTVTPGGPRVQRSLGGGEWQDVTAKAWPAGAPAPSMPFASGDLDDDGFLDLCFADGAVALAGNGSKRSLRVNLSARVSNAGGVGAKVEILAGSLRQKIETVAATPAPAPSDVQIGLGERTSVDTVRVLWPAGIIQSEMELPSAPVASARAWRLDVKELDRKPSSCPYLYAWNGSRFEFITDFMGAGEMGYWHAPGVFGFPDPDEYVLLREEQLRPRGGRYEIHVTNELEEVLYLDRLRLLAIAHPPGTEVHPSEGMTSPPGRPFALHVVRDLRPPHAARDEAGRDVLDRVLARDRRYPDTFALHRIRGYAEEHALVLDLGQDVGARPVLLLTGWTDYAFSSDNVAASHSGLALRPPALEARTPGGPWRTILEEVGVPVGRPQTVVLDLTGKLPPGAHEVRIATNMRIYWDEVRVGEAGQARDFSVKHLEPESATLRWRGFSAETTPDGREPFGYDFASVSPLSPWKVAPGRYTREGDVVPLLARTDDMFVVSRPGDDIAVTFDGRSVEAVPAGWRRTYLLYADGFSKEMDINSASPDVVEPLPFHGMSSYPYPPTEGYPDTREHAEYLRTYNTRVVARPILPIDAVAALGRGQR